MCIALRSRSRSCLRTRWHPPCRCNLPTVHGSREATLLAQLRCRKWVSYLGFYSSSCWIASVQSVGARAGACSAAPLAADARCVFRCPHVRNLCCLRAVGSWCPAPGQEQLCSCGCVCVASVLVSSRRRVIGGMLGAGDAPSASCLEALRALPPSPWGPNPVLTKFGDEFVRPQRGLRDAIAPAPHLTNRGHKFHLHSYSPAVFTMSPRGSP